MTGEEFEDWEEGNRRRCRLLCRFLTWRYGRTVKPPSFEEPHWLYRPLRFADTREPV